MKVMLPVLLGKVQTMADRSVKMEFQTRELPPNEMATLFELGRKEAEGWLLFAGNQLNEVDIPNEPAVAEYKGKTPAQRLRAVLYRWWEQQGSQADFEDFYQLKMSNLIDQVKEKLE